MVILEHVFGLILRYFRSFWYSLGHLRVFFFPFCFRGILGIGAFWGIARRFGPRGRPPPTPQNPLATPISLPLRKLIDIGDGFWGLGWGRPRGSHFLAKLQNVPIPKCPQNSPKMSQNALKCSQMPQNTSKYPQISAPGLPRHSWACQSDS